ncbi:MAG: glycoside hydrolase family 97 protein [Prevotella sp.]|nr:glycoside hydrolase family 97 protein [Prevotella sp.]
MLLLAGSIFAEAWGASKVVLLESPDRQTQVTIATGSLSALNWAVSRKGVAVLEPSHIGIQTDGPAVRDARGKVTRRQSKRTQFSTPFYRKAAVSDVYNSLTLSFASGIDVEFRAYDDGAAYRFILNRPKATVINSEQAEFRFAGDWKAFVPYVNDNRGGEAYCYSFESYYDEQPLSAMFRDSLAITPLAVCLPGGMKAVIMDAGVEDYPGMMLVKGDGNSLQATFAPYPLEQEVGGFDRLNIVPTRRASYIARLDGQRTLPWRAVVVSERDADLLNCDMAQRLAPPCRITDTSWIRPGKVAWDWWNNTNLTGVPFVAGMNTDTYIYYIDFAARNHLEYIIIDEGWSGKESLLSELNPAIDLPRLISHARQKGIGIILWSSWRNLIGNNTEGETPLTDKVMQHYADMGISGFKVDFFDRDDQQVIASAYRIAAAAARHHLVLDYHGLKPFGIQRAYPNIFNFEGVKGLENSKWEPRVGNAPLHDQPHYDVTIPYLRMLCGPLDYTPGAMTNALRDSFFGNNDHPMSQGTRVHQMAMYATFEAPLQMLADSPTKYMKEQECTDFIAQIPTTFDETVALDGELGAYTLLARRKGSVWYIAALTDWTPRDLTLSLSFLGEGTHQADIFADGVNAHREATDYSHTQRQVSATDTLSLHLSSGGGWTAIIR